MKKKGGKLKWIVLAIVVIGVAGAALGGGSDDSSSGGSSSSGDAKKVEKKAKKKITYQKVTATDLQKALKDNSAKASKMYKGKYISITGKVGNIDSDAAYFDIEGNDEDFSFASIQCFTKNKKQEDQVVELKKDGKVTVKGKCTDVGEVMGYSIDIQSIN